MKRTARLSVEILLILFMAAASAPAARPAPILVCVGMFNNAGKRDIGTDWLSSSFNDYSTVALHSIDGVWATKAEKLWSTATDLNLGDKVDNASASKLAKALHVRYLITGAYKVTSGKVAVTFACYDAKTNTRSKFIELSGTSENVFDLHELITVKIAGMLGISPTDPRLRAALLKAKTDWSPRAYYAHGAYELIMGNDYTAIAELESAISNGFRTADAYAMLSMGYEHKKDYKQAVEMSTKALEISPSCEAAYSSRALSYSGLKEYEKAIADDSVALVLDPNDVEALVHRGICNNSSDRPDLAIVDYNKALVAKPDIPLIYILRAHAYRKKKAYDQAMADCNKAISLNPNCSNAYESRGECYYRLKGDYDATIADLDTCIKLDGNNASAYSTRSCCYCYKYDYARAISDINKAIELDPNHAEHYSVRAWIYTEKGDFKSGTADCEKALALDSKCTDAFCSRANIEFHKGDYDAAIADANKAIGTDTKDDWSYLVLSRVGLAKKDYDLAWKNVKLYRDNFGHPEDSFIKDLEAASGRSE